MCGGFFHWVPSSEPMVNGATGGSDTVIGVPSDTAVREAVTHLTGPLSSLAAPRTPSPEAGTGSVASMSSPFAAAAAGGALSTGAEAGTEAEAVAADAGADAKETPPRTGTVNRAMVARLFTGTPGR